jgi:NADH-quinone oxidoreductase subunit E
MPTEQATSGASKRMPILGEALKERIRSLFPRYPSKQALTLPALHMVLEDLRCVPYQAVTEIAEVLELTPAEVHDTMSFYGFFPQAPLGDVRVWICRSLSCALRGGDELLDHACLRLGIEPGETTKGGELTVEFAECLGVCDYAPAAVADDGRVYGPLDEKAIDDMVEELKRGRRDEASASGARKVDKASRNKQRGTGRGNV